LKPEPLPSAPGTYLLVLHAEQAVQVRIGSLTQMEVLPGYYLYTGSAFGPGGLRARLGRHLGPPGVQRWHIDYLRCVARPVGAWYAPGPERWEHTWAQALSVHPSCQVALPRFGASDCRCPTHLFYCSELVEINFADQILRWHATSEFAL
jgi:Uri superfamily endonuclease